MKNPWLVIVIIVVVLLGGSVAYSQYVGSKSNEGVEVRDHVTGNPEAAVTLVEYSDFECPSCAQFHPHVKEVLEEHGDNIRFEYKHFPVIGNVPSAGRAAEAAGQQGEFFAYHDKLFQEQGTWSRSTNPQQYFEEYAEELGLDMGLFKQHMRSSLLQDKIDQDFQDGRALGVTGTPTFFLNGERMNIQTFAEFKEQIRAAVEGDDVTTDESSEEEEETNAEATSEENVEDEE